MRKTKKKAFTLIELLVVITIIGILAVGGIQIYTEQMKKARDSNRVRDLNILYSGMIQYELDNGTYYVRRGSTTTDFQSNLKIDLKPYIPNIYNIYDKKSDGCKTRNGTNVNCQYVYRYSTTNGITGFKLHAYLESMSNICIMPKKCLSSNDGGSSIASDDVFELGTNLALEVAQSNGIVFTEQTIP